MRLRVDWGAVRETLAGVARAHELEVAEAGVMALVSAARRADDAQARAEMERVLSAAEVAGVEGAPVNAALRDWVASLPAATCVGVLSLNGREAVGRAVERAGLGSRVAAIVAREDVTRMKPDPDGLLRLMARFGLSGPDTVLVGDSPGDLDCARAAGARGLHVREIGVRWEAALSDAPAE